MDSYMNKIKEKMNNCPKISKWLEMNKKRGNKFIWPNSEIDSDIIGNIKGISKKYYIYKPYNNVGYMTFIKPGFIIEKEDDNIYYEIYNIKEDGTEIKIDNTIKEYIDNKIKITFEWYIEGKNKFKILLKDYNIIYEYECYIFEINVIKDYYKIIYKELHNIEIDNFFIELNRFDLDWGYVNNIECPEIYLLDNSTFNKIGDFRLLRTIYDSDKNKIRYEYKLDLIDDYVPPQENKLYLIFRIKYLDFNNNEFYYITDLIRPDVYYFSSFNLDYNNIYLGNNNVNCENNYFYFSNLSIPFVGMSIDKFALFRLSIEDFNNNEYSNYEFVEHGNNRGDYADIPMYNLNPNYVYFIKIVYDIGVNKYVSGFIKKPIFRPQYYDLQNVGDLYIYQLKEVEIKYKIIDNRYIENTFKNMYILIKKMSFDNVILTCEYIDQYIDNNNYIHFQYEIRIIDQEPTSEDNNLKLYYEKTNDNYEILDATINYKSLMPRIGCFYISKNVINTNPLVKSSEYYYKYIYMNDIYHDLINLYIQDPGESSTQELLGFRNDMKSYIITDDSEYRYLTEYKNLSRDNFDNYGWGIISYKSKFNNRPLLDFKVLALLNADLVGRTVISLYEDVSIYLVYYYFNSTVAQNANILTISDIYLRSLCKDEQTGEEYNISIGNLYTSITKRREGTGLISDLVKLDYNAGIHNPRGHYPNVDFTKYDFKLFGNISLYINNTIISEPNVLLHNNIVKFEL
jgi:hypothetical protein